MTDNGTPPLSATPTTLIIPCKGVEEQPTFKNLPATVAVGEQGNEAQDSTLFTIAAADPDAGASLAYHIVVTPNDGNIILSGKSVLSLSGQPYSTAGSSKAITAARVLSSWIQIRPSGKKNLT
jgi:hypothetical protein